jgi:hypothetical protein
MKREKKNLMGRKLLLRLTAGIGAIALTAAVCGAGTSVFNPAGTVCAAETSGAAAGENADDLVIGMPNPWSDWASLDEAAAAAGFSLAVPDRSAEYAYRAFRTLKNADGTCLFEVLDRTSEDGAGPAYKEIRIRKSNESGEISGDYNNYPETREISVGSRRVTVRGANGKISAAAWTDGGYTYSVGFYVGNGVTESTAESVIAAIQ